jgi:hypothetical protein
MEGMYDRRDATRDEREPEGQCGTEREQSLHYASITDERDRCS